MNPETAELLIRCHRPATRGADARIQKAVKAAGKNPELKARLETQMKFDEQCVSAIGAIELPAGLAERLGAAEQRPPFDLKAAMRQPPFLAVVIALFVLAVWGVIYGWNRLQSFPGKDSAARLVEVNDEMTGMELEPKVAELGRLEDWFFSKYGFEHFYVPASVASLKTVGARVFKQDGVPVAQIAVERDNMICYAFHAEDLGVKIEPENQWRIFVDDEWAAAIQQHEDKCFMIAFRGKRAAMREFLTSLP